MFYSNASVRKSYKSKPYADAVQESSTSPTLTSNVPTVPEVQIPPVPVPFPNSNVNLVNQKMMRKDGDDVTKAVGFHQTNKDTQIKVTDVSEHLTVSSENTKVPEKDASFEDKEFV